MILSQWLRCASYYKVRRRVLAAHIDLLSEFNTSLRSDSRLKRMFDLGHLRDEVSGFDQFFRCVASGDDDVKRGLTFARGADFGKHFIDGQHAVAQDVNQ